MRDKTASHAMMTSIRCICLQGVKEDTAYSERPGQQTKSASHIRPLLQFMPFLLCSAKPTEHLFICVMVSTVGDADWVC